MVFPDTIRPILVEILINGTWTDITRYVLQRQNSSVNRGAGGEDNSMPPTTMQLLLRNDDGRFSQDNPTSPYWPYLQQSCQVRFKLTHSGVTYTRAWLETVNAPMVVEANPDLNVVTLDCAGLFQRWERTNVLDSPLKRTIRACPQLIAYWPMEDEGSNAQTLASAISGKPVMGIKSAIDVANYSGFVGSKPVPSIGDGQVTGRIPSYTPSGNQTLTWLTRGPVAVDDTTIGTALLSGGTIYRIALLAHTNGDVRLRMYDRDGSNLATTSYTGAHNINDRDVLVRFIVALSGSDTNWFIGVTNQADLSATTTSGTIAGEQIGQYQSLTFGYFNNLGCPVGHAAVYNGQPANLADITQAFGAYRGETTGARYRRICLENGISHRFIGDTSITMGPQPIGTIKDILQDCANVEHAPILESRDDFGLTMYTIESLYNQGDNKRLPPNIPVTTTGTSTSLTVSTDYAAWFWQGVQFQLRVASGDALTSATVFTVTSTSTSGSNLVVNFTTSSGTTPTTAHIVTIVRSGWLDFNFASKEVGFPFRPVKDDRLVANTVTIARKDGSSYTATLSVGSRSTKDPPEGIGIHETSDTLNVYSDGQLAPHATWQLGLGTNDEARFPDLDVNLHRRNLASRQAELLTADVGHLITVDNASGAYMFDQIRQIAAGYTETFDGNKFHTLTWNSVPGRPFDILEFDSNLWITAQGNSATPNYLITTDSIGYEVSVGETAWLRNSTGAVKQNTLFTVTSKVSAFGFTNLNFSPNASANTATGDILEIIRLDCRYSANSTVLAQTLTTTATGAVSVSVGQDVWNTDPETFPLDVLIAGERVTLTGISGGAGSIAFVGTGTASQADNGSVTPGLPAGALNNHVVLIQASIRNDAATVNLPANWTLIHSAGTNMKLMGRVYNGVWTMPTVTVSGGSSGDTVVAQSAAWSGISMSTVVTNTPLAGTGDDIKVTTNKMDSVAGQYGLRLASGLKFDDWTTIVSPSGLDEIEDFPTTLGNDMGQVWSYAIDASSANFAGITGTWTTTGGAAAFYESYVAFFPSTPQTFTISARSVNGVVKAHTVGDSVDVADTSNYGLE